MIGGTLKNTVSDRTTTTMAGRVELENETGIERIGYGNDKDEDMIMDMTK